MANGVVCGPDVTRVALGGCVIFPGDAIFIQEITQRLEVKARIDIRGDIVGVNRLNGCSRTSIASPSAAVRYVSRIRIFSCDGKEMIRETGTRFVGEEVVFERKVLSIGPVIWNV